MMFVEWYDKDAGKMRLFYLPKWQGIIVCLSGFGKWVPESEIIFED